MKEVCISHLLIFVRFFFRAHTLLTVTIFKLESLPPATKLGQGYVFTGVCDSVHSGGGVPYQVHPPGTRHTHPWDQVYPLGTRYTPPGPGTPPRPATPPRTRYTPLDQAHPPRPGPPWDQVHPPRPGPPWDQVHPPRPGTPPRTRYTPPNQEIWSTRGRYASYWNAILFGQFECDGIFKKVSIHVTCDSGF